jgi:hypothetical protein
MALSAPRGPASMRRCADARDHTHTAVGEQLHMHGPQAEEHHGRCRQNNRSTSDCVLDQRPSHAGAEACGDQQQQLVHAHCGKHAKRRQLHAAKTRTRPQRHTRRHLGMQTCKHANMQTCGHAAKQTSRQADIQKGRQADMQAADMRSRKTYAHAQYAHTRRGGGGVVCEGQTTSVFQSGKAAHGDTYRPPPPHLRLHPKHTPVTAHSSSGLRGPALANVAAMVVTLKKYRNTSQRMRRDCSRMMASTPTSHAHSTAAAGVGKRGGERMWRGWVEGLVGWGVVVCVRLCAEE